MHYSGYAYTDNVEEKQEKITKRYNEIRHIEQGLNLVVEHCYAHNNFTGRAESEEAKALTEMDILILADSGNLCFGGCCEMKSDGYFSGHYNTD